MGQGDPRSTNEPHVYCSKHLLWESDFTCSSNQRLSGFLHEPGEISQVWRFPDHLHMGGPHQTWEITIIVSLIQLIPSHITKSFPNNTSN